MLAASILSDHKRLRQILDQVVNILNADGQAHQRIGNPYAPALFRWNGCISHDGGMFDKALDRSKQQHSRPPRRSGAGPRPELFADAVRRGERRFSPGRHDCRSGCRDGAGIIDSQGYGACGCRAGSLSENSLPTARAVHIISPFDSPRSPTFLARRIRWPCFLRSRWATHRDAASRIARRR